MDGLGRAVGDGLSGLFDGVTRAIEAAISGAVASLGSAAPVGLLVVGGIVAIAIGWLVLRR